MDRLEKTGTSSSKESVSKPTSQSDDGIKNKRNLNGVTWGALTAIILTIVIYFAAQVVASLLVNLYPLIMGWNVQQVGQWLAHSIVAQFFYVLFAETLVVGSVGWYLYKRAHGNFKTIGLVRPRPRDLLYAVAGFFVYFPLVIVATSIVKGLYPSLNLTQSQQLGFSSAAGVGLVLAFIALVVLPPIAEEILMRGFLYLGLKKRFHAIPAAIATSVLFGLAHLEFGTGAPLLWTAAIDTFILSLVLVYVRELDGSLWPAIFLHMVKNGVAFASIFVLVLW